MEQLIKDLVPLFHFHPDEKLFPCTIDEYIKRADISLYKENTSLKAKAQLAHAIEVKELKKGPFTQKTLEEFSKNGMDFSVISMKLKDDPEVQEFIYRPLNPKAPVYVNYYTKDDKLYVNFSMMYPMDGGKLGTLAAGSHQSDFEFLIFELDKTTKAPLRVMFSSHGTAEGRWVPWADCQKTTPTVEDPVVRLKAYVSLLSHGNHYLPGSRVVYRLFGVGNDNTDDRGRTLIPQPALFDGDDIKIDVPVDFNNTRLYLRPDSIQVDNRFMSWKGSLGQDHIHFPNSQGYFRAIDGFGTAPPPNIKQIWTSGAMIALYVIIGLLIIYLLRNPLRKLGSKTFGYLAEKLKQMKERKKMVISSPIMPT